MDFLILSRLPILIQILFSNLFTTFKFFFLIAFQKISKGSLYSYNKKMGARVMTT